MADEQATPLFNEEEQKNANVRSQLDSLQNVFANNVSSTMDTGQDLQLGTGAQGVNLAGPSKGGLNFERYYGKKAYSYLGFNPYRDNETFYNENSSPIEDMADMQNQFWNLAGLGFASVLPVYSDREEAEIYESASNIGSTSRGGIFETVGNTYLNFGYTAGLLTEIAAEEVAMSLATMATFGGTGEAQALRTAKNVDRVTDAFSLADKMKKTRDRIKDLSKAYKAKSFYDKAGFVAKAVNPLRGTTDYLKTGAALDKAAGVGAVQRATKTFGSFYRDIREVNLAVDEAELESAFAINGIKDDLVNEYIKEHGEHPDTQELDRINNLAKQAADRTLAANVGLIYASNRVAFGNMFNKYMPKALGQTTRDVVGGRVAKNFKTKKLTFVEHGKGFKDAYKTFINEAKFAKSNLKTMPLATAKFLGKYTRTNFGEGMQEYFQEVIQDAETSMANDQYLQGVKGGAWYSALNADEYMDQYTTSLNKFAGEEGLEVFGGGFLMGAFAGPFGRGVQGLQKGIGTTINKFYNRADYDSQKAADEAKAEIIKKQIDAFNDMTDTRKDFMFGYVDFLARQAAGKSNMEEAQEDRNIKAFLDEKDKMLVEQVLFAESMDAGDLLIEQLKDLGDMTDEELAEAFAENKDYDPDIMKSFSEDQAAAVKRAEEISQFSRDYDSIFPEPMVGGYDKDSDFEDQTATMENLIAARRRHKLDAIINQQALTRTMDRMESILRKPFKDRGVFWNKENVPPASEITNIFRPSGIPQELALLNDEIKSLEGFTNKTPDQRKDLAYKKKKRDILEKFNAKDGPLQSYINTLRETQADTIKEKQAEENANLEEGKVLHYEVKDNKWSGEIVGEDVKNGKERWLVRKDNGKVQPILKTSKGILGPKTKAEQAKNPMAKPTAAIEKVFRDYLNTVAKNYNNSVNNSRFNEVFEEFKDYLDLSEDEKNLHETVDFLMNREAHYEMIDRYNNLIKKQYQSREEDLEKQLKTYLDNQDVNILINKLAKKFNVVVEESELESLIKDQIVPETYYNVETGIKLSEGSETYDQVIAEVRDYLGMDEVEEEVVVEETPDTTSTEGEQTAEGIINIDTTPFSEWPVDIRSRATNMMNKYNKETNIEGDPEDDAFSDPAEFVSLNNPGYEKVAPLIEEYNKQFETKEAPAEEVVEEVPEEELTVAEKLSRMAEKNKGMQLEEAEEPGIEAIETGKAFEINVNDKLESSLFSGDRSFVAFNPLSATAESPIEQILQGLRDGKVFKADGNLEDLQPGTVVTIYKKTGPTSRSFVRLTYMGKKNFKDLNLSDADTIKKFDLKKPGEYPRGQLIVGGSIYEVPTPVHQQWMEGKGKFPVFEVSEPVIKKTAASEESATAWKDNIEKRLSQSTDLNATRDTLIQENTDRMVEGRPSIETEEITALYEKAQSELTPDKLTVNKEYRVNIKGKNGNFGTALVISTSKEGVTFKSTGKETKGEPRYINAETLPKVLKGEVSTDMRAEDVVEKPKTTPEQKEVNKKNQETNKEIKQEEFDEAVAEVDAQLEGGQSLKELKAALRKQQREDNSKCD